MPPDDSRLLDVRTSPVAERIAAPATPGRRLRGALQPLPRGGAAGLEEAWAELLRHLDDVPPDRVKRQAAAEVITLTHNRELHEVNLGWHPRAEEVLWRPELQQAKRSENGALNVRYRNSVKAGAVERLRRASPPTRPGCASGTPSEVAPPSRAPRRSARRVRRT